MFNYTCLNPIAGVGLDLFSDDYKKVDDIKDADAALVRSAAMHDMELGDKVLAVARAGAGVNNIPLDKCAEQGIVVFNTPGANANGVKELVFAGMLYASRDIVGGIDWCLANQNDENIAKTAEKQKKNFAGTEISGKKLGVIGLGAIGVLVANAAVHMGMDVYGYDPYISVNAAWNLSRSVKHISNVEDIYKNCDFITIHVPLLDSTKKMVNADAIAMMKPTAIVLNFARDLLVDEEAMVDALAKGKVKKYVSDFPNNTTVGAKGCIVTPHLGASTAESEDNCAVMAVKELRDYLENGNIVHSVNFPDCSMGACTASGRVGILHKNVKGMIGQITTALAEADINVSDLTNKGKGDYAYSLLDLDSAIDASTVEKLSAIDGVLKDMSRKPLISSVMVICSSKFDAYNEIETDLARIPIVIWDVVQTDNTLEHLVSAINEIIVRGTYYVNGEMLTMSERYLKLLCSHLGNSVGGIIDIKEKKEDYVVVERQVILNRPRLEEVVKELSTGQLQILSLITYICANVHLNSLIVIDEPEVHLHPRLITNFVKTLNELLESFEKTRTTATPLRTASI